MSIKMEGKFEAALSRIDAIIVKLRQPYSQPLNVPWYPTGHPQIPIEEVTNPNLISTSLKGTPVKLKFPKFPFFKEGDPREWICEIEKCFDFYEIPGVHEISESQKLNCATLHLRGRASQWFHRHIKPQIHEISWSLFLEELIDQFDSTELGDSNTSVVVDEVKVSDVVSCGKNRDGVVFDCLMNLEMEDYSGEKSSEVFDEMQNQEGEGEVKVVIVEPVVRVMVEGDINRQEINKLFQLHFVKTAWAILSCAQSVKTKSQSRCSKGKGTYLQLKEFLNMSSLTVCKNASEKFLLLWFRWWEEYRGVKIVKEFVGATVREFNFLISISINDGLYRMGAVFSHLTVNRRVKNALVSVYSTHGSMENAVFYVASPEACAAILWKSAKASPKAAEKLKMTATELCKLQIADGVIPEPLGGAHADPSWTSQQIKRAVVEAMDELLEMYTPKLLNHRNLKFRKLGGFIEGETIDPVKKINMKAKEELLIPDEELAVTSVVDIKHEVEKLKEQILDSKEGSSSEAKSVAVDKLVEKLNKEVNQEISKAAEFMGLRDQLDMIRNEMVKANCSSDSNLKNRIEKFNQEFGQGLAGSPNYGNLIHKLTVLKELAKMQKSMPLKQELNKRLKEVMNNPDVKEKIEKLKEEISNSGVSNAADLDDGLKEKILMVKKEIASGVSKTLKSMNLDIELVADINIGYEDIVNTQVLALNGKPVKNLKELAAMVESCSEEFLQFDLEYQQLVVLETKTAKAATPDILTTHCIPSAMSDELKT